MTPAIRHVEKAQLPFEVRAYPHDPRTESYGVEAATRLGVPPEWVFKTLIVKLESQELLVTMLPVHLSLDLKRVAAVAHAKRAEMATVIEAERATGYVVGGISPLGQRKQLRTLIDESILSLDRAYFSAGRRGLELVMHPSDLIRLCAATVAPITR